MNKKSILIVEDEAIVSLDLSLLLENSGYEVNRICSSSDELFAGLRSDPKPDLILMDINIKGEMDGLESSMKVRELYGIPVIFLTAYADRATLAKAKDSFPYGYIIKPYDKSRLLIVIEMALNIIGLEQEVSMREELFSATLNSIGDAVIITDHENGIKYMNPAAILLSGVEQYGDKNFDSLFPIEYSVSRKRGIFTDGEGNDKTLEVKKTSLNEPVFAMGGSVWILTDITLQLFLETQLRESHKMEAVGRLAGGVAHDFNNLLTVIMGYCSLILDNKDLMDRESSLENDIKGIQTTSQKAVKLTKQLLTFSEKQVHNPRKIDLNGIILDLDRIFERMIPHKIELRINLTESETVISIDPVQLEQILINLVVNSRDAISGAGMIDISTEIFNADDNTYLRTGKLPEGEYVRLSINDNGAGIPYEIQSKIFEPFFTTKSGGKGIGLGLSTVYGIIQNSGGFVDLESEPGSGSLFNLYFPRLESTIKEKGSDKPSSVSDLGNEAVLIVEEDDFVRSIMVRILRNKKYAVTETSNAGEALLLCEKRTVPFDLLITDMFMPLISGEELSHRIIVFFPQIKTLYTSTAQSRKSELEYFIQKPFDPDDFSLLVRKCLDAD